MQLISKLYIFPFEFFLVGLELILSFLRIMLSSSSFHLEKALFFPTLWDKEEVIWVVFPPTLIITIINILGVVHKWRHGRRGGKGQGFCDNSTKA